MNIPRTKAFFTNIDPKLGRGKKWIYRSHLHLPIKLVFGHLSEPNWFDFLNILIQGSFAAWIVTQIKDPIGSDGFAVVVWRAAATPSAATAAG
jgi:hypothetical protein